MSDDIDKHVEALQKSAYHKNGACVCRHNSNLKAGCKYDKNGFMITRKARAPLYNAPTRFAAKNADAVAQQMRKVGKKLVASPYAQDPDRKDKTVSEWNVGVSLVDRATSAPLPENFLPLWMGGVGFHHPYLHNWHHMIPNQMLVTCLYDKTLGYQLLEVLMAGRYNINGPRNIVLLPQQRRVGQIIKWPIHPNNHGRFDQFAKEKIGDLKMRLKQALDDSKHPVNNKTTKDIATNLDNISDQLFKILEQMPPGTHINEIRATAERLAQPGGQT